MKINSLDNYALDHLQLSTSVVRRNLDDFIQTNHVIGTDNNIVNLFTRKKYSIPKNQHDDLYKILNECYKANLTTCYAMIQKHSGSGLFFRCNIESKTEIEEHIVQTIIHEIVINLSEYVNFPKTGLISYVTVTPTYIDITIPTISVCAKVKYAIVTDIIESKILESYNGITIDKLSYNIPVPFFGSTKSPSQNFDLYNIYSVIPSPSRSKNSVKLQPMIVPKTDKFLKKSFNICKDLALTVDEKVEYKEGTEHNLPMLPQNIDKSGFNFNLSINDNELDSLEMELILFLFRKEIEIFGANDTEVKKILLIAAAVMSGPKYIKMIKNINLFDDPDNVKFNDVVAAVKLLKILNNAGYPTPDKIPEILINANKFIPLVGINFSTIKWELQKGHNDMFNAIHRKYSLKHLHKCIYDIKSLGMLEHFDISELLYLNMQDLYRVDVESGRKNNIWYEFMTDEQIEGEIYKWKETNKNNSLSKYMSKELYNLFDDIIKAINSNSQKTNDDKKMEKYFKDLHKNVMLSSRKLKNHTFKNQTLKECMALFESRGFTQSLNKDPNILGVGNGVLYLSGKPILMQTLHNFHVSKYTKTNYIPYSPSNNYVVRVEKIISDMFPENEYDAMHWILFYMSTSLDAHVKDSLFTILHGAGSNGKSIIMELLIKVLSDKYMKKMPIQMLCAGRSKAESASPVLIQLKATRMAYYSESEKQAKLNVAILKEITGQETMTARKLNCDQEQFKPTCNHMSLSNYRYIIQSTMHALWRRIKFYSMKIKFCDNPDEKNPFEKKVDRNIGKYYVNDPRYGEAFMSILTKYHSELITKYDGKLSNVSSPTMDKETLAYRNSQDMLNKYISERMVKTSEEISTALEDVATAYICWYQRFVSDDQKFSIGEVMEQFKNSRIKGLITNRNNAFVMIGVRTVLSSQDIREDESTL